MSTTPKTWIIVKDNYVGEKTELNYTLGNGTTGKYEAQSDNTLIISSINGIKENDTIVLDMTNIDSYSAASGYIKTINVKINVVLFVGDGSYVSADSNGFSLSEFDYILTLRIRQQTNTTSVAAPVKLNKCANLTTIDIDRFNLSDLYLNNNPNLSGNLDLPNTLSSCSIINCGFESITSDGVINNLILKSLTKCKSINLSNASSSHIYIGGNTPEMFIIDTFPLLENLTISALDITSIILSSTAKNSVFKSLDLEGSTCTSIILPFNTFTGIQNLNLNNCSNFKGFNGIGKISGLPNTITSLKLSGTNTTEIEYDGSSNTKFTNLTLPNTIQKINLLNCKSLDSSIDPANMNSLEIFNIHNCNQSNSIEFNSTNLREIDISDNNISSISFMLKPTPTIESLNLENTGIAGNFENGTYNINLSELSTLKLAGTNITSISISYAENIIGKITDFSLPSSCTSLNISNQDSINNLSSILENGINLVTLVANNCNIKGNLEINSTALSVVSLEDNPDLSTFDLSNYRNLTSFDLLNTSITDININSDSTIVTATHSMSTKNIVFTKAIFSEALRNPEFYNGNSPNLESLSLTDTNISSLTCSYCSKLKSISVNKSIELSTLRIDNCINLSNNYLQNVSISESAEFINLGSNVPDSLKNIKPKSLMISKTNWSTFSLNGELLNNSETSIVIKANNALSSLSFLNIPTKPIYRNLDISYNTKLKSINDRTNILDICDLLNANLIRFRDIDNYNKLNINFVMNAFTADETPDLPMYLGIWPQIKDWDGMSGKLLGEINFIPILENKIVTGQFIGIYEKPRIYKLLQSSFNNISVWIPDNYRTLENLSTLTFPNILSLYIADINGTVSDDSVIVNDQKLSDILRSMFERNVKPEMIYTNSTELQTLANEYNIPVQILHTSTENWNPDYIPPNVFKVQFIIEI